MAEKRSPQTLLEKKIDFWSSNVFDWLDRGTVGTSLAPISSSFDALADAHLFGKNRSFGRLEIWRALNGEGPELIDRFEDGFYKKLPIPQTPPPHNFIAFKSICIRYIDHTVIAFLHRIHRLFRQSAIALKIAIWPQSVLAWHAMAQQIWPLAVANLCQLSVDNTESMSSTCTWVQSCGFPGSRFSNVFARLRQFVSPSVLCDCSNLRQIESDGLFPEGPPDDHPNASDGQALAKWLHTTREDGKPKLLNVEAWTGQFHAQIEQLKEAFLGASLPVSYAVRLSVHLRGAYVPFAVDNGQTGECLTFRPIDKSDSFWLLKRAPITDHHYQQPQKRRESEGAAAAETDCWRWTSRHSVLRVQLEDRDIGPLSMF